MPQMFCRETTLLHDWLQLTRLSVRKHLGFVAGCGRSQQGCCIDAQPPITGSQNCSAQVNRNYCGYQRLSGNRLGGAREHAPCNNVGLFTIAASPSHGGILNRAPRYGFLFACIVVAGTARLDAQTPMGPRAQTSRAEIEATIAEADKILSSPGYSSRLKAAKRREVALLRHRLAEGDLQQGDQLILVVQGETGLTGTFTVGPTRSLTLPAIGEIPLKGVLRAEVREYLTTQLRKYLKDPAVQVQTTLRLSLLGAVARPGFHQVASEQMIGDAIMVAGGGLAGGTDPNKTRVMRNGTEIMSKEAFTKALQEGKTLDQLSLLAGDEILVGGDRIARAPQSFFSVALPAITGMLSLTFLIVQVF